MDSEGRTWQVDGKEQCILSLLLVDEYGWGLVDGGIGWGQILKAFLKQAKDFTAGSHHRSFSGLMMDLVLFFRKITWLAV